MRGADIKVGVTYAVTGNTGWRDRTYVNAVKFTPEFINKHNIYGTCESNGLWRVCERVQYGEGKDLGWYATKPRYVVAEWDEYVKAQAEARERSDREWEERMARQQAHEQRVKEFKREAEVLNQRIEERFGFTDGIFVDYAGHITISTPAFHVLGELLSDDV